MMRAVAFTLMLSLTACASTEEAPPAAKPEVTELKPEQPAAPAPEPTPEAAEPAKKKCPKKSTLVNGKCVMQVEE